MFKDALIIFKKELSNIFKDKRTLFSVFILPLILMPAIFLTIGFVTDTQKKDAEEKIYSLEIINNNDPVFTQILSKNLKYQVPKSDKDENLIKVEFPKDFKTGNFAEVKIYYNSTSQKSEYAGSMVEAALNIYQTVIAEQKLNKVGLSQKDLQTINIKKVDTAPKEAQGNNFLATMIPYMLLIYIFAGGMGMGMDTTAGEKERGSLASLLVNQVSRTSIAMGKVLYVIVSGILSSISSFAGLVIAFVLNSKLFGQTEMGGNANFFTPLNLIGLLLTIFVLSGLAASIIVFLGALAKNMKEASGYVMPVYILAVVVGVASMGMDTTNNLTLYFIPVVNCVFLLKDIIMSQLGLVKFLITILVNSAIISIFIWLTSKLFNSEKIMNTI